MSHVTVRILELNLVSSVGFSSDGTVGVLPDAHREVYSR
jgi:hypothetical protein